MRVVPALLALILAGATQVAAAVEVDYDREVDFSRYRTFAWLEGGTKKAPDPFADKRIRKAVEAELTARGLVEVGRGQRPDVLVAYRSTTRERVNITGYGHRRWGGDVWATRYTEGTLIVDIVDAEAKELVWRAVATSVVGDPEKAEKKITKAVRKMFRKFPPK